MQPAITTGVLGLGIIGGLWARNLEADGWLRGAWNRTPQPAFPRWMDHPADVARHADALIIVVADPAAVESVLDAIRPALEPRHLVIQSSTIDPASNDRFEALVRSRGASYVAAPFTGSKPAAEQRQNVFYLGGDPTAVERAQAVLSHLSQHRFAIGTGAQACTLKLACNLMITAQLEALCEAFAWARRAGVADEVFFDALRPNVAWSGLAKLKETKLRQGDFAPQFSVKHMLKDMRLCAQTAGPDLPVLSVLIERLADAARAGRADEDISAILTGLR